MEAQRDLPGWWPHPYGGGKYTWTPRGGGMKPVCGTTHSPALALFLSFIWLYLNCILYNKSVILSIGFSVSAVNHSSKLSNMKGTRNI